MSSPLLHATAAVALLATAAGAQTVSFKFIEGADSANDMSPDGRWVVGESSGQPYLLDTTTDAMTLLPAPGISAVAVSDDGTVVLGDIPDPEGIGSNVAAIWTSATGWESLGHLPNALACPSLSDGYELSADGTVAVGLSWDGCSGRGFRWTAATGMLELEPLANGGNRASVLSADGTLIGGFAQGSFSRTPAIWDDTTAGQLIDPPDGDALGEVYGMRDDGSIMLGEWNGLAVKWSFPGLVRAAIGAGSLLPGWEGIPQDIADDGTVVGFDFLQGARRAWIQPGGTGDLVELEAWLESLGETLPPNTTLEVCQAISADGGRIIGHGFFTGAWTVVIGTPCPGDLNDDNVVDVSDLLLLLGNWGLDGPGADAAEPLDEVTVADLLVLLGAWGPCP